MSQVLHSHPAARRPFLAGLVLVGVGFVGGGAWAFLPRPDVVLPLVALMLIQLLPFLAPTEYRFDDEKLEVACAGFSNRHRWARFRGFQVQRRGLLLVPAAGGRWWSLRSSVFLPMDAELQAQALPLLEGRLPCA
jgi:hypothetical protein